MTPQPTPVENWRLYEDMVRRGEYGPGFLVSDEGLLSLIPEMEEKAAFFVGVLQGCKRVLDVGCGLGFPSLVIAPHVGELVAIDGAPTMVARTKEYVRQLGYRNMTVLHAQAEALPFGEDEFDGASLSGILGSLSRPDLLLVELHRVIQPGGVVACAVQNFADKLRVEEKRYFSALRLDDEAVSLQTVEYLFDPYRIRTTQYSIQQGSEFYLQLLEKHPELRSQPVPTEMTPDDLPAGAVESVTYNDETMFDDTTLTQAFSDARFRQALMEFRRYFDVEYIHAVFVNEVQGSRFKVQG